MLQPAPIRIQRKRTKGWQMPENTMYVGRPTFYGNPYGFSEWEPGSRAEFVDKYRATLTAQLGMADSRPLVWVATHSAIDALRGKNLACWCPLSEPCHAAVLLEIANGWMHRDR